MSTLDTKLTAEEEKAVIDKVYETLSKDIKEVVDALKDEEENNDQSAEQNIQQLSARLDQGFYNYCKEIFKDQEQITEIKKAINAALLKFPKNNDLIKLKSFVEGTKTYTDNTKTETFEGTGRNINRFNGTTEQQKKLTENLNNLNSNINTLPETNLKTLLNAMLTVARSPTGKGTQALQYYIYNELPDNQKENFLVKNKKRGFTGTEITPEAFDGIKGYNTLTAFINISNAKIDKYNKDKQDIDNNNTVFNQLMGNSDENTRIINEALAKAEANKAKKEAEEEQKRKIDAGLQEQNEFISSFKTMGRLPSQNEIPPQTQEKLQKKIADLQEEGNKLLEKNKNEDKARYNEIKNLLAHPVEIYKRIRIGEEIQKRIKLLQTSLQNQTIKPEDLTGTGFEIKNNLVVISSAFEKALKAENLWDEEEITENKSKQRESRDTFETTLLTKLTTIETQYKAYKKTIQSFKENAEKKYHCIITINDKECDIQRKGLYEGNTQETAQNNILNSRKQLRTQLDEKYKPIINQITNLQSHGVVFSEDGTASKIKNNANYEEIYNIIKTTVQDYEDEAEEVTSNLNLSNITEDSEEDAPNPEVEEVQNDEEFDNLCGLQNITPKEGQQIINYANKNQKSNLNLSFNTILNFNSLNNKNTNIDYNRRYDSQNTLTTEDIGNINQITGNLIFRKLTIDSDISSLACQKLCVTNLSIKNINDLNGFQQKLQICDFDLNSLPDISNLQCSELILGVPENFDINTISSQTLQYLSQYKNKLTVYTTNGDITETVKTKIQELQNK